MPRGRPRKPDSEKRRAVSVRFHPSCLDGLRTFAVGAGLTVSQSIELACLAFLSDAGIPLKAAAPRKRRAPIDDRQLLLWPNDYRVANDDPVTPAPVIPETTDRSCQTS